MLTTVPREARDRGLVEIRVDGRTLAASSTARDLSEAYGLTDCYIAQMGSDVVPSRAEVLRQVGRVAAAAFIEIVEPGDRIGVAWGETVFAVAQALPRAEAEGAAVYQMIGSMVSARVPASEDCTIRIAHQLCAKCYTLHAPAVVSDGDLARRLRAEPTIAKQLDALRDLDLTVVSVGAVVPGTHFHAAGMASQAEMEDAAEKGAAGIICCRYIDAAGRKVEDVAGDCRVVGIDVPDIGQARKRLLVASGRERAAAVRATLAGGLATHLCVDGALAQALLLPALTTSEGRRVR